MKTASSYQPSIPASILIIGPPGSGKTTLAMQFPKPFVLNVDNNINGPIRWSKANGHSLDDVSFDDVMFCDNPDDLTKLGMKASEVPPVGPHGSIPVPRAWRYRRAASLLEDAIASGAQTIVIDSFTSLNNVIQDEVRRQLNLPLSEVIGSKLSRTIDKRPEKDGFALWDGYLSLAKNLIFELKANAPTLVCIGHVTSKEVAAGRVESFIAIPGQFGEQVAGYFEEVWLIEVDAISTPPKRTIRTQPKPRERALGLKSAAGLPVEQPMNFDELFQKLKGLA